MAPTVSLQCRKLIILFYPFGRFGHEVILPEKQIALPESVMFIELLIKGETKLSEKNIKTCQNILFLHKNEQCGIFLKIAGREMVGLPPFFLSLS